MANQKQGFVVFQAGTVVKVQTATDSISDREGRFWIPTEEQTRVVVELHQDVQGELSGIPYYHQRGRKTFPKFSVPSSPERRTLNAEDFQTEANLSAIASGLVGETLPAKYYTLLDHFITNRRQLNGEIGRLEESFLAAHPEILTVLETRGVPDGCVMGQFELIVPTDRKMKLVHYKGEPK